MTEKSIAKFKYENSTYKLLEITMKVIKSDLETEMTKQTMYLIVKNRRRLYVCKWLEPAKKKYISIITADLLQQKINF